MGPKVPGENLRLLPDSHPVYTDPMNLLAGGYMAYFNAYRKPHWDSKFDFSHLEEEQEKWLS